MKSAVWIQKYFNDQYKQQAKKEGLRSRSWFKLEHINQVDKLFRIGMRVLDLGSAPGGWSLYVKNKIGDTGNIVACDILPMQNIDGVNFFLGDCTNIDFSKLLFSWMYNKKVQVVLSDMSPSITGISIIDVSRSIYLGNLVLNICSNVLISGGTLLVKIFQGAGFNEYVHNVRCLFRTVKIRKPISSRFCSREVYIVAKEYKKL